MLCRNETMEIGKSHKHILYLHGVARQIISHITLLSFYLRKLQVPSKQHFPCYWSCVSECHRLYQNHRFLKLSPLQPVASCLKKINKKTTKNKGCKTDTYFCSKLFVEIGWFKQNVTIQLL